MHPPKITTSRCRAVSRCDVALVGAAVPSSSAGARDGDGNTQYSVSSTDGTASPLAVHTSLHSITQASLRDLNV
ncbi:uncharacterized protein EI97DRAFT_430738 [Westerdykella ornata]|uniref:Uncharacterized protein n=1 Tax=Westerdykella ornata TaxID=318751 RepID=A0A6A6JTL7_WESOR|nr:uncharacterized protein EI97DRAFT_430738 [Westerdykella ornata]KAF2279707.1 hypothetical protein EI97DRAFT_430738 [Westerdykella ornata]